LVHRFTPSRIYQALKSQIKLLVSDENRDKRSFIKRRGMVTHELQFGSQRHGLILAFFPIVEENRAPSEKTM